MSDEVVTAMGRQPTANRSFFEIPKPEAMVKKSTQDGGGFDVPAARVGRQVG
jgi:hypothetical protein